uniref:Major facilitator superfamily (MFS) profile domain-containing protein n=1 Tax=Globodera rostochiensis TaxID=31243 RepID=A0A914IDF3_GLORO
MQSDLTTTNLPLSDEECARINLFSKCKTPDQILSILGPKNPFILYIWLSMAMVWALAAMPMMSGAFLMDDGCPMLSNRTSGQCNPNNGSIRAEFGLNENQSYLVEMSTSAFVGGMAVGSAITPIFTDLLGRRPVLVTILLIAGGSGCLSALSTNIFVFNALRFVQGLSFSGVSLTNWVLAYECIPMQLRAQSTLVFGLAWVLGYCLVAPMAYFIPNWRLLITMVSAPSLLFVIIFYFTVPESFHYLVSKKQTNLIVQWIKRANKFADFTKTAKIEQSDVELLIDHLEQQKLQRTDQNVAETVIKNEKMMTSKKSIMENIRANGMLIKYLIIFILLWVCDAFIYYGCRPCVFSPWLIEKLGRRLFTVFTHLLASLAFLSTPIFPANVPFVQLLLWLIAKFAIISSFTGLFVYASEVFPTLKRGICMGICTTISQICCIILPTAIRLMSTFSPIAPMLFFGVYAFVATLITFMLPETRGKELPD